MELYLFFFSRNILGVGCGRDIVQRDSVRVPLTAPKNILLSVHLVTLSLMRYQWICNESP